MDERIEKWLHDILNSITEIESFTEGKPKIFFAYQNDLITKRAVERNLEIIGEAMNRILQRDESYLQKINEARNIVGLRNQIIHSYDNLSDENIWAILINHIPKLKSEVKQLLNF